MKKLSKGLVFGFLTLALVVGVGAASANAALTFSALTIASDGALTASSSDNTANVTVGTATMTTGNTTIYGGTGSLALNLITGAGGIVNINNDGLVHATVIGSFVTTSKVIIRGGVGSTGSTVDTASISLSGGATGSILLGGPAQVGGIYIADPASTAISTIGIGTNAMANVITIGSTTGAASLALNAGSGNINLTGHLVSKGATAPTITESGAGAVTTMGDNTDNAGWLRTSVTSHTSVIITFAQAYALAPHCTFSPSDADAALLQLTSPGVYGTTTTTAFTLTHAASTAQADWEYVCVGAE